MVVGSSASATHNVIGSRLVANIQVSFVFWDYSSLSLRFHTLPKFTLAVLLCYMLLNNANPFRYTSLFRVYRHFGSGRTYCAAGVGQRSGQRLEGHGTE